jgi:hypothetical protein
MLAKKAMDHGASGVLSAMRTTIPADFHDLGEAEAYFREVLAPFGTLTDEHWCHITRHSVAWHASRERYVMLFDPQIVRAFGETHEQDYMKSRNADMRPRLCTSSKLKPSQTF